MCANTCIPLCVRTFLQDLHNPGDVYACYRVLFLVAFCIGTIPSQFSAQPFRALKNTIFGYINVTARIIFFSCVFCRIMNKEQSLLAHFYITSVSQFADSLQKVNGMFAIIIILVFGLLERNTLINLMQQYEYLELHFSRIGIQFKQKKCVWHINLVIFSIFFAHFLFMVYGHFLVFKHNGIILSWIAITSFYSPHIIINSVVAIYYTSLYKITLYFEALNQVVMKMF